MALRCSPTIRNRLWHPVHSPDINDYLKDLTGLDVSAKDFRTWNATVLAAVGLAVSPAPRTSASGRKRAVARVVTEVSQYLGNTPAVCGASYIYLRVIERYQRGDTIVAALDQLGDTGAVSLATQGPIEEAVLDLPRPGRWSRLRPVWSGYGRDHCWFLPPFCG